MADIDGSTAIAQEGARIKMLRDPRLHAAPASALVTLAYFCQQEASL
jgi:hypothetical protein